MYIHYQSSYFTKEIKKRAITKFSNFEFYWIYTTINEWYTSLSPFSQAEVEVPDYMPPILAITLDGRLAVSFRLNPPNFELTFSQSIVHDLGSIFDCLHERLLNYNFW